MRIAALRARSRNCRELCCSGSTTHAGQQRGLREPESQRLRGHKGRQREGGDRPLVCGKYRWIVVARRMYPRMTEWT